MSICGLIELLNDVEVVFEVVIMVIVLDQFVGFVDVCLSEYGLGYGLIELWNFVEDIVCEVIIVVV